MSDWSDLAMAEQHIADSDRRISKIVAHIEAKRAAGSDTAEAETPFQNGCASLGFG
jgi:hypothetical protein